MEMNRRIRICPSGPPRRRFGRLAATTAMLAVALIAAGVTAADPPNPGTQAPPADSRQAQPVEENQLGGTLGDYLQWLSLRTGVQQDVVLPYREHHLLAL